MKRLLYIVYILWAMRGAMAAPAAIAPAPIPNCVPVVLVNNTGQADDQLYFIAHALDPCGLPCYLVPDLTTGICSYVYPNVDGTPSSAALSITFDQLPPAKNINPQPGDAFVIYLPVCSSARGYISIGQPMYLPTIFNPAPSRMVLDIGDSSVTALNDVNYYTLYQDFEFGLVNYDPAANTTSTVATTLYINLSWVDYFCLPMHMAAYSYTGTGTDPLNLGQPYSGTLTNLTRENVINNMNTVFSAAPLKNAWLGLEIPFYANPYIVSGTNRIGSTRVLAAKNSIALGSTTQFKNVSSTTNPAQYFPSDYTSNTSNGPLTGQSYMLALYNYYLSHSFTFTITPPENTTSNTYTLTSVSGTTGLLQFTGSGTAPVPPTTQLQLFYDGVPTSTTGDTEVTTEQLLSGSVWPFSPAIAVGYTNELSKAVSALFSIGQMPVIAPFTSPFVSKAASSFNAPAEVPPGGFGELDPVSPNKNSYFQAIPGIPSTWTGGPWNNLYVDALHQNLDGQGVASSSLPYAVLNNVNLGLGYAYDYDDLLGMAGLMAMPVQDGNGNPYTDTSDSTQNSPYVVVVMESLSLTPVQEMDINNDTYTYSVSLTPAPNGVTVSFMYYYKSSDGTQILQNTIVPPTSGNTDYFNVYVDATHPFQVEFQYNSQTYVFNINLQRQIVTPSSAANAYSTQTQQLLEGVTFSVPITSIEAQFPKPLEPWFEVTTPNFGINVASSPPGWPG